MTDDATLLDDLESQLAESKHREDVARYQLSERTAQLEIERDVAMEELVLAKALLDEQWPAAVLGAMVFSDADAEELCARWKARRATLDEVNAAPVGLHFTPCPNTDGEHLTCIICDHGHEEHRPPPEWLVTMRTPNDGTLTKGLHQCCWDRHRTSRFGGAKSAERS